MANHKVTLCPAGCGQCPDVEIAGDEVRIGETGNTTLQPGQWHHITSCDPAKDDLTKHPDWVESIIPGNAIETRYLFVPTDKLSRVDIAAIKKLGSQIGVLGFVEYCDGFARVHCMSFCASYKDDARHDFVPCLRGVMDYCPIGFGPPEPDLEPTSKKETDLSR